MDKIKSTIAEDAAKVQAKVNETEGNLSEKVAELDSQLQAKIAETKEEVSEGLAKAEQRRDSSVGIERTAWSSECERISNALASSTKALVDDLAAAASGLAARCGAAETEIAAVGPRLSGVEATLSSAIAAEQAERRAAMAELTATTQTSAKELSDLMAVKVETGEALVERQISTMGADIAQTSEDVLAIRKVMETKIDQECEALESSLQRATRQFSEQLKAFQEDTNATVVVRLDEFSESTRQPPPYCDSMGCL